VLLTAETLFQPLSGFLTIISFFSVAFYDLGISDSLRHTDTATETDNSGNCKSTPLVASSASMPMRAALTHSLWEQEDSNENFLQAPVASSLGENLLGP
jgi:hypothetical protein